MFFSVFLPNSLKVQYRFLRKAEKPLNYTFLGRCVVDAMSLAHGKNVWNAEFLVGRGGPIDNVFPFAFVITGSLPDRGRWSP